MTGNTLAGLTEGDKILLAAPANNTPVMLPARVSDTLLAIQSKS